MHCRRDETSNESWRQLSTEYHLWQPVCKVMFLSSLNAGDWSVHNYQHRWHSPGSRQEVSSCQKSTTHSPMSEGQFNSTSEASITETACEVCDYFTLCWCFYRLHPLIADSELLDCVNETAATHNIKAVEVTCIKLKSKYVALYSLFYVSERVEAQQFTLLIYLCQLNPGQPVSL